MSDLSTRIEDLSPEELSELLTRLDSEGGDATAPAQGSEAELRRRGPDQPPVLALAQERLWFIHRLHPHHAPYNVVLTTLLRGDFSPGWLQAALDATVARHETLRCAIREVDGEPVPRVSAPQPFPLRHLDLGALPQGRRRGEAERVATAVALAPFDLARQPLMRVLLADLGGDRRLLCLSMHHVISDGWSLGVLFRDLGELYSAARAGRAAELPELPIDYFDYAVWQHRRLAAGDMEPHLEYWRRHLAGLPPVLELPLDRPRPDRPSRDGGGIHMLRLDPGLSGDLADLARARGVTGFVLMTAAYMVLLARWSGQTRFAVGAPVSGRNWIELEDLVGLLVNNLVLVAETGGDPTFERFLRRVETTVLDAFAHQEVPFQHLVTEFAPERRLNRNPFFQVMINRVPVEEPRFAGLELEPAGMGRWAARMDLIAFLRDSSDGTAIQLEYDRGLFDTATVERMASHFHNLLRGIVESPSCPLGALPMLGEAERRGLLLQAGRDTAYDRNAGLGALFVEVARRHRDDPAVEILGEGGRPVARHTYGEVLGCAVRLAKELGRRGVRRGDRVAIHGERSAEVLEAILATVLAGAAYVPLDPAYPPAALARMMEDTGVRILVRAGGREVTPEVPAGVEVLDLGASLEQGGVEEGRAELGGVAEGGDLAYVMYTSGSTGVPKGVAVPQRAVARLVREADFADLGPQTCFLQLAPLSFDAATLEIWGPWLNGGRVVVAPPGTPSLRGLAEALEHGGIDSLWLTAGLFHQVVDEELESLSGLRQLLAGGDVLSPGALARVRRRFPDLRLVNGYGPTENTTFTCCHQVEEVGDGPVPVGRPVADTRVYVADPGLGLASAGVIGELVTGGDGLARGYWGRPALTAQRFVPDPFSGEAGSRLYRTGDRVRWRDGVVHFLGRVDSQVKVRGFRVELGEVEVALSSHPDVVRAAVAVRGSGAEGKRLVAWVVPLDGADPAPAELRDWLGQRLPAHMVPSRFTTLSELPLNPNGKVDRSALPDPGYRVEREHVAPRTAVESMLCELWADLLEVPRVGVDDDFFELGGHSLLATRLASRLRETFRVEIPVRDIFEHPSVAALARDVGRRLGSALPAAAMERVGRERPLPLSFSQQRLWFIDRLEPGSAAYNLSTHLRMAGSLDLGAVAGSVAALVRRHEALRTVFQRGREGPEQVVRSAGPVPLPYIDLRHLPTAGRRPAAERLASLEALRPFDLETGPLFRASLVVVSDDEYLLNLAMHHVVSDGWSMGVLVRDLSAFYTAYTADEAPDLPDLPIQYADYAVWQRRHLGGKALEREVEYWRQRFADPPQRLNLLGPGAGGEARGVGASQRVVLDEALTAKVGALAAGLGATPFVILLAAFKVLLLRYSGQSDLCVGSPVAGRDRVETEDLVGFFVNTLALRTDLSGAPAFREVVERVRETSLSALGHQNLPFDRLVEIVQPQRTGSRNPLFQAVFAFHTLPGGSLRLPGVAPEPMVPERRPAKFDLTWLTWREDGRIVGHAEFDTGLMSAATAERFVHHYQRLLAAMAADPDAPVTALSMLSPEELREVLARSGHASAYPRVASLAELFLETAARHPEAPALAEAVGAGPGSRPVELTYAELRDRASALAAELQRRGVGPGERVAVQGERGIDLLVGVLATSLAGGAYVPLDPAYPAERRRMMLRDVAPRVFLRRQAEAGDGEAPEPLDIDGVEELDLHGHWATAEVPSARATGDDLAYICFTSGSTGAPKGVAVPQRAVVRLVREADFAAIEEGGRWLVMAPLSFDASTLEVWAPWLNGGCAVVAPLGPLSLNRLAEVLARGRIDHMWLTAGLFHQVVEEEPDALAGLRCLLTGGDVLSPAAVAKVRWRFPRLRLVNGYGPTENTTFTSCHAVEEMPPGDGFASSIPIGRPIADTTVFVADDRLQWLPVGNAGELWTGGDGLARGYWGRPALTAERFVPHPEPRESGERLYRTGDLARWRDDGELEFLGRVDAQIKVRGFRIEPGEVEAALADHADVAQAVVVAKGDGADDKRLVAYLASPEPPASEDLRTFLADRLPRYMVPDLFVFLPFLPLTANGKVDRRALPDPEGGGETAYVAPRTPVETLVADLWQGLLDVERVGAEDDFFELGGHSLLATQVAARLHEMFGLAVPLGVLFENPAVADLSRAIESLIAEREGMLLPPLRRVARRQGDAAPSFAQERLWFLHRLDPSDPSYNMAFAVHLEGLLDVGVLMRTVGELVRRHEALRTILPDVDGQPVQRVLGPSADFDLPVIDLGRLEGSAGEGEARRLLRWAARRPFDLLTEAPLRVLLLRHGEQSSRLALTLHHVAGDGWSMEVLVREVRSLYAAFLDGRPSPLAPLPIQYADYAAWQRNWLEGEVLERHLDYWRSVLDGADADLGLPERESPPGGIDGRAGQLTVPLSAHLLERLTHLSREEGTTLFMTLLTAFMALLHRYTGRESLLLGIPVAGRNQPELRPLIGFFVNLLVIRGDLGGDPSFRQLLVRMREAALGAYVHQELPYQKLLQEVQPGGHSSLFEALFALEDEVEPLHLRGLREASGLGGEAEGRKFDLMLLMRKAGDELTATFSYNRQRYEDAVVSRMAEHLGRLLTSVAETPDMALLDVPLEGGEEIAIFDTADREEMELAEFEFGL